MDRLSAVLTPLLWQRKGDQVNSMISCWISGLLLQYNRLKLHVELWHIKQALD